MTYAAASVMSSYINTKFEGDTWLTKLHQSFSVCSHRSMSRVKSLGLVSDVTVWCDFLTLYYCITN